MSYSHSISTRMINLVDKASIIPIIEIEDTRHAVPLAETLINAGMSVIEVVLRTANALEAIREIAQNTTCTVGAGSLVSVDDVIKAREAGASFGVSPGSTPALVDACMDLDFPYLPGGVTASEMMNLAEKGITMLKFFPAEPSGGIPYLKSIMGPLPHLRFCPTGGVNESNFMDYLSLENVACVGGSWIAPTKSINDQDWETISYNVERNLSIRDGVLKIN